MAEVIEFYVPKSVRKPLTSAPGPQPGEVIEFWARTKKSVQVNQSVIWKLDGGREANKSGACGIQ
jgi:hypothetical protein